HLVELIPYKKDISVLTMDDLRLPMDDPIELKASSLAYHLLHDDQAHGVAAVWRKVSASKELLPVFIDEVGSLQDFLPGRPEQLELIFEYFLDGILRRLR